jgi:K+-transporting ATPase KdpC subunit
MKEIKPAILMLILFTVICGGIYPAAVTGLAQVIFPMQAKGSFITDHTGKEVGSALIGQPFSDPKYLWPRPSASTDFAYNPMASGGSNASPNNPAYLKTVDERLQGLRDTGVNGPVAADLVQASAKRPRPTHFAAGSKRPNPPYRPGPQPERGVGIPRYRLPPGRPPIRIYGRAADKCACRKPGVG